ncbi:MAG: epoxyqueuosine reductase QueH, partial [Rickettsiales bacterium]|nr:epoxyqueuosine reductase QueH [Rickettsiales bacterium]
MNTRSTQRAILDPVPGGGNRVLLHSCCAPCSGELMEAMLDAGIDLTIFFYNPNIHPKKEYEIRKSENIRYAEKMGIPFVDADYDVQNWFARAKGMEYEPERGIRCTMCFDMRFERTALYAHEHGFDVFTSSLGISRWKNM